MAELTDNQYLEMANHAKQVIDRKEKVIEFLKSKISDIEDHLREVEYKTKQMEHLIEYEKSVSKNKEFKSLLTYLEKDVKFIYNIIDEQRVSCQEDVEEEIILIFESINED
tara:strand:- start:68 stop:400 length:333 start_codon:yes stop_codon:yes gene_type:complete